MATIIPAGQFNPASLQVSGFYVQIINPPSYIRGVPTDVVGAVGTASWGPVNQAVHCGSGQDGVMAFGPVTAAALTDPYDLPSDINIAFLQASSQASLEGWFVRVTDGTDVAASTALAGAATAVSETATIGGTFASGDTLALTATGSFTGSPVTVTYTTTATDTASSSAVALAALVNGNAALTAANVVALVAGDIISLYTPSGLTVTWTDAVTPATGGPTITLGAGTASTAGATLNAIYTGSGGNSAKVTIAAGTQTNTFSVALVPPFGGTSEIYYNLPAAGFWKALANALANGISPARGPSHIARVAAGTVNNAVGTPTTGTFTLSGGTDGRAGVVTATLIGSDTAQPRTGMYALRNLNPGVGIVWIAGLTDPTAAPSVLAFGTSESCSTLFPFASGTTTAAAVAAVATNGLADPSFNYVKDWVYWFDTANKQQRLSPPTAFIGGTWATYAPQNSPDNKPVNGVLGTERNNPVTGNLPYTLSEIGQLQAAGIAIVTNPINAGTFWGIWGGRSTSADPATQPSEYWRMTTYLARSIAGFGGKYVGQLQSQQPADPLRRKLRTELNNFFNGLGDQIDGFTVLAELSTAANAKPGYGINTPSSIAQHYLYAMCVVRYLSSVWYFIMSLQGGTTVQVQIAQAQPTALAA